MALVHLESVTYTYPLESEPALTNIDLTIDEGQFVGIVGANGAGKSTLCYLLSGFIPHFFKGSVEGRVSIAGHDPRQQPLGEIVQDVGLVFQNPFTQMSGARFTVYEEVAFGLENLGLSREEMERRLAWVMELAGIEALGDRSPYALSGGQQQRVALASILVMRPRLLILDEPTSQLDPISSRELFAVIDRLSGEGITVILAGHKVEWIAGHADRVLALAAGHIIADGSPQEVLTSSVVSENGVALSRYTKLARAAREDGLWPAQRTLPVTLEQAVAGFRALQEIS